MAGAPITPFLLNYENVNGTKTLLPAGLCIVQVLQSAILRFCCFFVPREPAVTGALWWAMTKMYLYLLEIKILKKFWGGYRPTLYPHISPLPTPVRHTLYPQGAMRRLDPLAFSAQFLGFQRHPTDVFCRIRPWPLDAFSRIVFHAAPAFLFENLVINRLARASTIPTSFKLK